MYSYIATAKILRLMPIPCDQAGMYMGTANHKPKLPKYLPSSSMKKSGQANSFGHT